MVCFTKILCVGLSILALAASDNPQESRTRRHLTLNGGRESVLRGTNEVKKSALEEVRELNSRILKGSKGYYGKGKGGYYAKSSKGPKGSKGGYGKGKGSGYYMVSRKKSRLRLYHNMPGLADVNSLGSRITSTRDSSEESEGCKRTT